MTSGGRRDDSVLLEGKGEIDCDFDAAAGSVETAEPADGDGRDCQCQSWNYCQWMVEAVQSEERGVCRSKNLYFDSGVEVVSRTHRFEFAEICDSDPCPYFLLQNRALK